MTFLSVQWWKFYEFRFEQAAHTLSAKSKLVWIANILLYSDIPQQKKIFWKSWYLGKCKEKDIFKKISVNLLFFSINPKL